MTRPRIAPGTRQRLGFTLIEVMFVVAVIGVLAAISLPTYQQYIRRGNRAEARTGLLQAAHWLERVATARGSYLKTSEVDTSFPAALRNVPSRTYALSLEGTDESGAGYTLKAIPQNGQAGDECGEFTLTQTGVRALSSPSAAAELTAECWNR
ncbi:type IV pilin protein [Variovorax humicola]|uniref:Type IV pilin protein n=1 Tax=Variovorax humicola TaxID=1769758 RepID=A0ABU8VYR4_9BURK